MAAIVVQVNNLSDYIVALTGISGELDYEYFCNNSPYTIAYLYKKIKQMINEGLILKSVAKTKDGQEIKVIRLSYPKGYNRLGEISEEFQKHFEELTLYNNGKTKKFYAGNPSTRLRQIMASKLPLFMKFNFLGDTDLMDVEYVARQDKPAPQPKKYSPYNKDGILKTDVEILRSCDSKLHYLTAKLFFKDYERTDVVSSERILSSKVIGMFAKEERLLPVFFCEETFAKWIYKAERSFLSYITHLQRELYPASGRESECVFFLPCKEDLKEYIEQGAPNKAKCNPGALYSKTYIIPFRENPEQVMMMIFNKAVSEDLFKKRLANNYQPENNIEGYLQGSPVYSILDCELSKMRNIARTIEDGAHLVCYDWQAEIMKDIIGRDRPIDYMHLSTDVLRYFIEEGGYTL